MAIIKVLVSNKIHFKPKNYEQNILTVNLAGAPDTWI